MVAEDWSDNVYIVHLADDPAFSDELEQFERQLETAPRHCVLDLGSVTFVNSSNLSQLLRMRRATSEAGCRMILAAVAPGVWNTFLVSGLDKVFFTAENVPLALARLQLDEATTQ